MEIDNGMIKISFTQEETNAFIRGAENGRRYFSSGFTELLTKRLNLLGTNCCLKRIYNWFSKKGGRKVNTPFWVGKYSCLHEKCSQVFECQIIEPYDLNFNVSVNATGKDIGHEIVSVTKAIRGVKRREMANRIVANGLINTRSELILSESKYISLLFSQLL